MLGTTEALNDTAMKRWMSSLSRGHLQFSGRKTLEKNIEKYLTYFVVSDMKKNSRIY